MTRFVLPCLLTVFLVLSGLAAVRAAPVLDDQAPRISVTKSYLHIDKDAAATMATAEARVRLLRQAMRRLASLETVRTADAAGQVHHPNLLALADAVYETPVLVTGYGRRTSEVTVTMNATPKDQDLEGLVGRALLQPDNLALREEILVRQEVLASRFDAMHKAGDRDGIQVIVNEVIQLEQYRALIDSRQAGWDDPGKVTARLEQAVIEAPDSALLRNALGDVLLQLGRSQEAFEQQSRAIALDPRLARAYHARGTAELALGHIAASIADFSEAVRLAPQVAVFRRDRGLARELLGDTEAMCRDFRDACRLGLCDKLTWTVDARRCPQVPAP